MYIFATNAVLEIAEEQYLFEVSGVQCSTMFRPRLPSADRLTGLAPWEKNN